MGLFKLYIDYIKHCFQKRKQAKQKQPLDSEEIREEIWNADFSKKQLCRFQEEKYDGYIAKFENDENSESYFSLELMRKHLYAWTSNNIFRYKDFFLEAEFEFPNDKIRTINEQTNDNAEATAIKNAGSYAAGFLFRHISDKAFYSVLISNKGWLRLDAVVNSTPIPIIGWTKPLTEITSLIYNLKLICAGTTITVLVNDIWLGKFESDIIQAAGKIAFAGQNWEDYPNVKFKLRKFNINSKPIDVEEYDSKINTPENISPEAYVNLANTYFAMGKYISAIYQLKQAWKIRKPVLQDYILAGRIFFAQKLLQEAENEFIKALEKDDKNIEILTELASVYYQSGQIEKLKQTIKKIPDEKINESVLLCSLKGHLLSINAEHEKAAQMYKQAFEIQPNHGLFKYNEGNELNLAGKTEKAVDCYVKAANLFLTSEEYEDMQTVLDTLMRLAPNDERTLTIAGKFYYAEEEYDKSFEYLAKVCSLKTKDSTAWYLYGMLLQKKDKIKALEAFKKASKLQPDSGLYYFRLAEALYITGKEYKDVLANAEQLEPENGWIYNLKALGELKQNNIISAYDEIQKARKFLPDEIVVFENFIEIMRRQNKLQDCKTFFDIENGTADIAVERNRGKAFHIYANALFLNEEFDTAEEWYRKALKLMPDDVELLTDKAENDLRIGYLNEADNLLVKALDKNPSERIYKLIADTSIKKGDYARCEIVLRTAIDNFPDSANLWLYLADFYITINRPAQAKEIVNKIKADFGKEVQNELKELSQKIK